MASLIKNQILKHLSKFTKNLSPDKLQLSAMKGSCEVTNIELNEEVLMQLLELPVWLQLTRASCNYASIKIQWMKLKTIPIYILLDEVIIDVETCENFRKESSASDTFSSNQDSGSYGFTQKVIDGISLSINSVMIQMTSKIFSASFELTRINIESRNCLWKKVDDLSKTRIRDPQRGQVLIFKHLEWQTLRFVAKSESKTAIGQAPLRLISNQAQMRITLKKRLSDCNLLAARIMFIFEDLLWIFTDSQILSALHFADYLGDLIKKAPRTKRFDNNSDSKINLNNNNSLQINNNNNVQQQFRNKFINLANSTTNTLKSPNSFTSSISLLFSQHDIKETSHHIIIRRIEIHLMDDLGPQSERSQCPELIEGGALQISFYKLFIDFYPYHLTDGGASGDRTHWFRYNDPSPHRNSFILHKLNAFFKKQQLILKKEGSNFDIESLKSHLISQVLIIRLNDYSIGCVSTNRKSSRTKDKSKNGAAEQQKLIFYDNSVTALPGNVPPIYIELNNYFFCEPFDKLNFKMPETNIFAVIAPLKIHFEPLTILWINSFFANLHNALMKLKEAFPVPDNRSQDKPNIRVEILMPTVLIKLQEREDLLNNLNYDCLEIKISKIVLYNCDSFINKEYFRNLDQLMKQFSTNIDFFYEHLNYPWLGCDMKPISKEFIKKINSLFLNNNQPSIDIDFFAVHIEPLWIEIKSSKTGQNETLLDPINLTLWLDQKDEKVESDIDLNIFIRIADAIKVQLKHDQFLFLLRMIEMIGDFTSNLNYDTYMIQRSQYKKDRDQINLENNQPAIKYSLDLEDKIIKTIFKNTAVCTCIPDINLFLILKQFEEEISMEEINSSSNVSNVDVDDQSLCPSPCETLLLNECKLPSDQILLSSTDSTNVIETNHILNNVESKPTTETTQIITNNNNNSIGQEFIMLPKSPSQELNGGENCFVKNLQEKSSSTLLSDNNYNINNKKNITVFDPSNIRIHYAIDNDDAVSTISDFSADESDQQSMIALINEEADLFDDILTDNLPIEEALDVTENLNLNIDNENSSGDLLGDDKFSLGTNNNNKIETSTKTLYFDVLQIKINGLNLVQQSSKGFLSQVFLNGTLNHLKEFRKLAKNDYLELFKTLKISETLQQQQQSPSDDDYSTTKTNQLTLRIDSFSKGTLKDELISIYVNDLYQSLNKETIDLLVDFLNDNLTEKVAPMAILLNDVKFKIIDNSVRVPPMLFQVPKLALNRTKENKWLIEMFNNNFLSKDVPITNQLLWQHLKIFERNLIFDVLDLIKEQDRLKENKLITDTMDSNQNDTQDILIQVLNQKELLLSEIELLRKENEKLRKIIEKK